MKTDKIKSILKPNATYSYENGKFIFADNSLSLDISAGKGLLARIQASLKKRGSLYNFLKHAFSPVLPSRSFRKHLNNLLDSHGPEHVIINLGSGPTCLRGRSDIINMDIFAFHDVDIVADAKELPLNDSTADLIINIAMLEHTSKPKVIVQELQRILKPGGSLFCYVPFVVPFHAAPDDYQRWTMAGCELLFSQFSTNDVYVGAGPTSGALWVLQEWLAITLSFGNEKVHDLLLLIFMVLTAPIKLTDYILENHPKASNIASGFIIVCTK